MKFILLTIGLFLSTVAAAHTDHAMGEGSFHTFYHIAFWTLVALVAIKGAMWIRSRNVNKERK
ncbi:hypothetical protein [Algibacillus agarilyticus]|uniref:hypothetical protein n=1 Tax=Algibacillus agarilyticus TaxID=2234133 RepID=UPI000DD0C8DC|nr:hypothetical protein [Algibacillus agarilyticus]